MNSSRLQITGWPTVWWKREPRHYAAARAGDAATILDANFRFDDHKLKQEIVLTYFLSKSSEPEFLISSFF